MATDPLQTDVLIIGAGAAGLRAAIEVARAGGRCCILCKGIPARSSATYVANGMAVSLGYSDPRDGPDVHFQDTVKGGAFLNDQRLTRILVEEARGDFLEMQKLGARFDQTPDGRVAQMKRGGHSYGRLCSSHGTAGGQEIALTLLRAAMGMGVSVYSDFLAADLLLKDGLAVGAVGLDLKTGLIRSVVAGATILATGGAGRVYPVSSMPPELTGDGYSLAYRAGAILVDMEMVQFHPGGLYLPGMLKGAGTHEPSHYANLGGRLINSLGARFMERYDPRLESATRDVVSRAEYLEIQQGRGSPNGGIYLDLTGLTPQARAALPRSSGRFFDACMTCGVDPREVGLIDIGPTVHYFMGGVRTDDQGATSVPGLFACGEVTGAIHGANRLSGNSIAETLVFGRRTGAGAASLARERPRHAPASLLSAAEGGAQGWLEGVGAAGAPRPLAAEREIQSIMWRQVGVARDGAGLRDAVEALARLRDAEMGGRGDGGTGRHGDLRTRPLPLGEGRGEGLTQHTAHSTQYPSPGRYDREWLTALEVRSLLDTAELIARSALVREESRGAHYRLDHPRRDDACWLVHVAVARGPDGPRVWAEPVDLSEVDPREAR